MHNKSSNRILLTFFLGLTATFVFALLTLDFSIRPTTKVNKSMSKVESAAADFAKLPLSFEPNYGQTDEAVKFLSRGKGYSLFLTETAAVFHLQKQKSESPAVLTMSLDGANRSPEINGQNELAGKSNYLVGANPENWRTDVRLNTSRN